MSDRTTVRLDAISHSTLELLKNEMDETPSRIIKRLIYEGKLSDVPTVGTTKFQITVRFDIAARERIEELKALFAIDTSELIRRLLWNRANALSNSLELEVTKELTSKAAACKAFEYIIALRATVKKYRALASMARPDGQYFHDASIKAALLEMHADEWFQAIGRYLKDGKP